MHLLHQSLDMIAKRSGRPSPELGGSTVSLLSALLGLAVLRMAFSVSAEKGDNPQAEEGVLRLDRFAESISDIAEEDRSIFSAYLDAVGEGGERLDEIRSQTFPPMLAGAEQLAEALELASAATVARAVASDLYAGGAILDAAFSGVSLAIRANLSHGTPRDDGTVRPRLEALDARRRIAYSRLTTSAASAGLPL